MRNATGRALGLLMAEDDEDDRMLALEALHECRLGGNVAFVADGVELLRYLRRQDEHRDAPRPALVLLDLNMPRMSGREALAEIKADPELRRIPVVILTTSRAEEDVLRSYELGAAGYVVKPVTFDELVEAMGAIGRYWTKVVELPPE